LGHSKADLAAKIEELKCLKASSTVELQRLQQELEERATEAATAAAAACSELAGVKGELEAGAVYQGSPQPSILALNPQPSTLSPQPSTWNPNLKL
jgi:hypothetical protein